MVMGAVMLGGIITGKPPVTLKQVTPLARLNQRIQRVRAARRFSRSRTWAK